MDACQQIAIANGFIIFSFWLDMSVIQPSQPAAVKGSAAFIILNRSAEI
jgi:hypothetical protein